MKRHIDKKNKKLSDIIHITLYDIVMVKKAGITVESSLKWKEKPYV